MTSPSNDGASIKHEFGLATSHLYVHFRSWFMTICMCPQGVQVSLLNLLCSQTPLFEEIFGNCHGKVQIRCPCINESMRCNVSASFSSRKRGANTHAVNEGRPLMLMETSQTCPVFVKMSVYSNTLMMLASIVPSVKAPCPLLLIVMLIILVASVKFCTIASTKEAATIAYIALSNYYAIEAMPE